MMTKRLLELPTRIYDKWPIWLFVPTVLLMVEVFFFLGSLLYGIPLTLAFAIYGAVSQTMDGLTADNFPLHLELLAFLPVSLVLFAWVKWVEKRSLSSLGFFKKHWLRELGLGFLVGFLQFSLSLGLIWLFGGVELTKIDLAASTWGYVLSLIPFWLIQGGTEELLTRGWLLPVLNKRTNLAWALGLSSSLFGLMHLGNDHMSFLSILNLILAGVSMGLYMLKRDNLWGAIGLHGSWNFVQGNIYGIAVSGMPMTGSLLTFTNKSGAADWLTGGYFGTEGSLMTVLVELALIAYLAYGLWQDKVKAETTPVSQLN